MKRKCLLWPLAKGDVDRRSPAGLRLAVATGALTPADLTPFEAMLLKRASAHTPGLAAREAYEAGALTATALKAVARQYHLAGTAARKALWRQLEKEVRSCRDLRKRAITDPRSAGLSPSELPSTWLAKVPEDRHDAIAAMVAQAADTASPEL